MTEKRDIKNKEYSIDELLTFIFEDRLDTLSPAERALAASILAITEQINGLMNEAPEEIFQQFGIILLWTSRKAKAVAHLTRGASDLMMRAKDTWERSLYDEDEGEGGDDDSR